MLPLYTLALATVLLLCSVAAQRPLVLPLVTSDFEQKTQAATGQTTGVWCSPKIELTLPCMIDLQASSVAESLCLDPRLIRLPCSVCQPCIVVQAALLYFSFLGKVTVISSCTAL